jgi:hypothetical protein
MAEVAAEAMADQGSAVAAAIVVHRAGTAGRRRGLAASAVRAVLEVLAVPEGPAVLAEPEGPAASAASVGPGDPEVSAVSAAPDDPEVLAVSAALAVSAELAA